MSKAFTKVYIHYVWATKKRQNVLTKKVIESLKTHIREYCQQKGIYVYEVNGFLNHLHLLIDLPATKSVAEVINLIKGESSHWINSTNLLPGKFAWQIRYSAFSVSASKKKVVANYIRNQESHHRKKSFIEELKLFYEQYGLDLKGLSEMP